MGEEKKKDNVENEEDIREFKEVMETLQNTVPAIIRGIVDALYSSQSAEDFGRQVANFYRSMIDAGMDKNQAFQLTREFMESRDIVGLLKKMFSEGNWKKWAGYSKEGVDVEEIVDKTIKETMEEIDKEKE